MRITKILRGTASFAVLAAFATAGSAYAQDDQISSVDELVVTAQKREQNLQDVPIVVTSLPEQLLENNGVKDIKDMQILTPGLTVSSTSNEAQTTARIRGVGTVGDNPGLESSVGVVIDGVYRPRNGVSFGDLGEMQRIEVLKGPQGTLFGKNTSAGVINVITKAPSFDFGAQGELTAGNYGALGASASVTGPLAGDTLAGRLFVAKRERDGFYDVKTGDGPRTLKEDADQNYWTARGQLLFLPSDDVEIRVIGDYTKREENCCAAVQLNTGPTAALVNMLAAGGQGVAAPANPSARVAYSNRGTGQQIEDMGVSVEANIDLSALNATLTSVTAVRSWESVNGFDIDYTGADILHRDPNGDFSSGFDTLSQELRLAGSTDKFEWLVGGFYASEDLSRNDAYIFGSDYEFFLGGLMSSKLAAIPTSTVPVNPAFMSIVTGMAPGTVFPAGSGGKDHYDQTSHTVALFTNDTWKVTDKFDLTLGLRYTIEEKEVFTRQTNYGGNGAACAAALGNTAALGAYLTPRLPAVPGLVSSTVSSLVGYTCLPWANAGFTNRTTQQDRTEKEWSGTLKGAYRFNDDVMAYASAARGYKAGGFNLDRAQSGNGLSTGPAGIVPVADTSFAGEFADSYELGVKTTWLDSTLLLNASLFHQEFTDFQLNTFVGTGYVVQSIPEVTSKGVDADFLWFTPIEGLTWQGGVTYADTKYGKNFTPVKELSLLPGRQMSFAPEWSVSTAWSYDHSIGHGLRALFSLAGKYTSEYNTGSDLLPAKQQDAMTLWNGRVGFGSEDERWTVEIWGQNLTDELYYQTVFNAPLQGSAFQDAPVASGPYAGTYYDPAKDSQTYNAFLGQPRTYGVTLRIKY